MPTPFGIPLGLCLAVVAVVAAILAGQINRAIYSFSYFNPRPLSPWSRVAADAPRRTWLDCVPIVGWLRLRREHNLHEPGFWVRPMLIELVATVAMPCLYYAVLAKTLLPANPAIPNITTWESLLNGQFLSHAALICFMTVATFIDFDEKMIPDEITIPGTLLGLILAAAWPFSFRLDGTSNPLGPANAPVTLQLLRGADPWPAWLDGVYGLALGIAIFVGWCFALLPYLCTTRRGWLKGLQYAVASAYRGSAWKFLGPLAIAGAVAISLVWANGSVLRWQTLLSALMGVAGGGAVVWSVRIVGQVALGKEAMGFGDVTLMSMIGAYMGWQACVMIFFMAPLAALLFALAQTLMSGRRDIPFGPYLCAATLFCIVAWPLVWFGYAKPIFALGGMLLAALAIIMVLMLGLLMLWRITESVLFPQASR